MNQITDFELITTYIGGIFLKTTCVISKPAYSMTILPVIAGMTIKSGVPTMMLLLAAVILADFITGMIASYIEWKDGKVETPNVYFIESKKIRNTIVKSLSYLLFIALIAFFEVAFFTVNIPRLSEILSSKEFTGTEIAIGICVVIEFYSVLENFKRGGVDIIGKVKTVFGKIKSTKDALVSLIKKNK
tara:strand:- start:430 stop:993 length:564 start_codon:yes stop_codon:yes gene_type:complete